jgi:pyridoxal phosphate enzyme (YggS family)
MTEINLKNIEESNNRQISGQISTTSLDIATNLTTIRAEVAKACQIINRSADLVNLMAVSKKASIERIIEAINCGCNYFAENYVQEAKEKWTEIANRGFFNQFPLLKLAFIGKIQSNKVPEIVKLFSIVEGVDNIKIATALNLEAQKQKKKLAILIQVNVGEEEQKSGVMPADLATLVDFVRSQDYLILKGLMAIPPVPKNYVPAKPAPEEQVPEKQVNETALYFALLNRLAKKHKIDYLSMGMSGDYLLAINCGSNEIRLGTAIFGARS